MKSQNELKLDTSTTKNIPKNILQCISNNAKSIAIIIKNSMTVAKLLKNAYEKIQQVLNTFITSCNKDCSQKALLESTTNKKFCDLIIQTQQNL